MNRLVLLLLAVFIVLPYYPAFSSTLTSSFLGLAVYSDGTVLVSQSLNVSSTDSSISVPLLSAVISNVVIVDQKGAPLSFSVSGSNITVYSLGATGVTMTYDTANLTGKQGTVWSLNFRTYYNATVTFPKFSTLINVSGAPYSVSKVGDSPVAVVSPGVWGMNYGLAISARSTTNSSGGGTNQGTIFAFDAGTFAYLLAPVLIAAGGGVGFVLWRRRSSLGKAAAELRPDDVQVLNFISEKGGKVLEPEIRMKLALPKTSAWRQIKRLERLGYVKVTRIGSQNQIELLKNREPGA
ncbi:MAG: hypothetical protein HY297_01030 [Thaumarchaeota archaeon]|nr:hypothetical protein [Nitrososphaerota archaeon]